MNQPLPGDLIEIISTPDDPLLHMAWKANDLILVQRTDNKDDLCFALGFDRESRAQVWGACLSLSAVRRVAWAIVTPSGRFRIIK